MQRLIKFEVWCSGLSAVTEIPETLSKLFKEQNKTKESKIVPTVELSSSSESSDTNVTMQMTKFEDNLHNLKMNS